MTNILRRPPQGQTYSGKFAGKKGQHFNTLQVAHRCLEHTVGHGLHRHGMFRDEANRILYRIPLLSLSRFELAAVLVHSVIPFLNLDVGQEL